MAPGDTPPQEMKQYLAAWNEADVAVVAGDGRLASVTGFLDKA